jgi:hypothetical protein
MQHMIQAPIAMGALYGSHVLRLFHHAKQTLVPLRIRA